LLGAKISVESWRQNCIWPVSHKALVRDPVSNHEMGALPWWSDDATARPKSGLHSERRLDDVTCSLFIRRANYDLCTV
jgi:hypothetical protein